MEDHTHPEQIVSGNLVKEKELLVRLVPSKRREEELFDIRKEKMGKKGGLTENGKELLVSLAGDRRWLHRPARLAKKLLSVSIHDLNKIYWNQLHQENYNAQIPPDSPSRISRRSRG